MENISQNKYEEVKQDNKKCIKEKYAHYKSVCVKGLSDLENCQKKQENIKFKIAN